MLLHSLAGFLRGSPTLFFYLCQKTGKFFVVNIFEFLAIEGCDKNPFVRAE